jgi:hypothetical protein
MEQPRFAPLTARSSRTGAQAALGLVRNERAALWGGCSISGEGGIRTPGTREGTSVFETDPIDHSGTSPIRGGEDSRARFRRERA